MEILFNIGLCPRRRSPRAPRRLSDVLEAVSLVPPRTWWYWSMAD